MFFGAAQAQTFNQPQKVATLFSVPSDFEHNLLNLLIYAFSALLVLLIVSLWWIVRLRKRAHECQMTVDEANRNRRELLSKNDSLTVEIDRLKGVELELRTSAERYRTYIEHAPMGIFVTHAHDAFAFELVNPAMSLMTGFSKNELSAMRLTELFSSETSTESVTFFESIHQKGSSEKEVTLRKKDGSVFVSYMRAITLPGDLVMGFCMDITERKIAEEKIHSLAFFDALTALPNRRRLLDRLRQALSSSVVAFFSSFVCM